MHGENDAENKKKKTKETQKKCLQTKDTFDHIPSFFVLFSVSVCFFFVLVVFF